ncbi:Cas1p-domain-containing protein [Gloeophyllum trabeum ATCC 11539]|uniref:Cas1p-domain-containing protein n=1 Tax=Gloeophyllum trabeum (strain ATCC 11539 / FP-39264 / Madison 617) TaxID=670483 RepID=S7S420_GLOTA|nr:Cas1p-domain-containing protein [Gloeophyllum trabeum ATCC 11539]EPQ60594.1 Cas1p-domain-containing protein [Gloeophyllum trabeum ATCC 11539]
MPPGRLSFSLNPSWMHYVSRAALAVALIAGLLRYALLDYFDPLRCGALLSKGRFLDDKRQNWQPDGCMMHRYMEKDSSRCLSGRDVIFIGDSVTRKLFFQFAHVVDPALPTSPPADDQKHSDHTLVSDSGTRLTFYWDPFLNSSRVTEFVAVERGSGVADGRHPQPALLVLGSGLWYLRYSDSSGGLPAWESNTERLLGHISRAPELVADEIVMLPVEEVVSTKLTRERADTMRIADIDAMNSDLYHRINPPSSDTVRLFYSSHPPLPVSFPSAFNLMLDPSRTDDGLHFSDDVVNIQAHILLNSRCNDVLPKRFPFDKTCCRRYPWPSALYLVFLSVVFLLGPYKFASSWYRKGYAMSAVYETMDENKPLLVYSGILCLIFMADRTSFWLKEQKQFDAWMFGGFSFLSLVAGLSTLRKSDKDLGFLNREQTDEWKGWMQIAILIYHYLGASKVSVIYNPIRVLVASYLFMTGYGHTTFYVKKADFGFRRVAQVMVRLNLFTLLLAYTMNTDYLSYYFTPLVSMWFLIIYGTLAIGCHYNDRFPFLVTKIFASMGLVSLFMREHWLLQTFFYILQRTCAIRWSADEWAFRVNLDLWIVYFGMFTALATIKIREYRLTEHPHWHTAVKSAIVISGLVLVWYMLFEVSQPTKFVYNTWHPYISFLPIGAFVILRNASNVLRSASSRLFAFVGRCSLETFIIQFHLWLAADTKGILIVIPATRWRMTNLVITTIVFVYASHLVAEATGEITTWICGSDSKTLPLTARAPTTAQIPLAGGPSDETGKGADGADEPEAASQHVPSWADRLAEGSTGSSSSAFRLWSSSDRWDLGLKTKVLLGVGLMWLLNVLWPVS